MYVSWNFCRGGYYPPVFVQAYFANYVVVTLFVGRCGHRPLQNVSCCSYCIALAVEDASPYRLTAVELLLLYVKWAENSSPLLKSAENPWICSRKFLCLFLKIVEFFSVLCYTVVCRLLQIYKNIRFYYKL